jgi:hypothetical protein
MVGTAPGLDIAAITIRRHSIEIHTDHWYVGCRGTVVLVSSVGELTRKDAGFLDAVCELIGRAVEGLRREANCIVLEVEGGVALRLGWP